MNPSDKIAKRFTYKDALWLPQWNRMANEADGLNEEVLSNLKTLFGKMDGVREFFGLPIIVHVTYRPEAYNQLVKGAKNSTHKYGMACDFHVAGIDCDAARSKILDAKKLEEWNMRMEDLSDKESRNWIHLDIKELPPGGNRYFKP
jgi:uncharacterized protein YcbK (DUF882 family)